MPQGAREIDGQLGFNAQSPAKVISGRSVRGKSIMTGSRKKKKKKNSGKKHYGILRQEMLHVIYYKNKLQSGQCKQEYI